MDARLKITETPESLTCSEAVIADLQDQIETLRAEKKREELKNDTLYRFLDHFLSDFEGYFSAEDEAPSWEAANNYVEAAKYCQNHFDRRENMIRHVEEWMMNQILPAPRTPRDYDFNY